jgi:two-component system chemotaxis response regulator CheY
MFPPKTHILVVDDMEPMRRALRGLLRELGYQNVVDASSVNQAIQVLETGAATGRGIELILSDWMMPGRTGLEFLRFVRATEPYTKLPFILVTSESQHGQIIDAIQSGVSSYVVKPVNLSQLESKLKAVWAKINANRPA